MASMGRYSVCNAMAPGTRTVIWSTHVPRMAATSWAMAALLGVQNSANSATSASVQYGTDHPIMASIDSNSNTLAPDAMNRLRALHLRKKNSHTEQMA